MLKAQRKQNKQQQTREQTKQRDEVAAPRKPFALLQLAAGIAFIGLVVAVQLDMTPGFMNSAATDQAVVADATAAGEPKEVVETEEGVAREIAAAEAKAVSVTQTTTAGRL